MKNIPFILLLYLCSILPASAQVSYFSLAQSSLPSWLDHRYDITFGGVLGGTDYTRGLGFQCAVVPLKNWNVFINHSKFKNHTGWVEKIIYKDSKGLVYENAIRQRFTEVGIAKVFPVSPHKSFYLGCGYGLGTSYVVYDKPYNSFLEASANLKVDKLFILPGYIYKKGFFRFNYNLQVMRLNFYKGTVTGNTTANDDEVLKHLEDSQKKVLFSQDISIAFHIKSFTCQLGYCNFIGSPESINGMQLSRFTGMGSLFFDLHPHEWRKSRH